MKAAQTSRLDAAIQVLRRSRDQKELRGAHSKHYLDAHAKFSALRWEHSVIGYGIAEKRTDGALTGEACLRFYVRRKVHKRRIRGEAVIPGEFSGVAGGKPWSIKTDVIEMRKLPAPQRTLGSGDSLGHVLGTSGTLGVRVTGDTGKHFILTCSHVAAPLGATVGSGLESPADFDKAPGPNVIGTLFSFTDLTPAVAHEVDAALVLPSAPHKVSNDRLRLSDPPRFSRLSPNNFHQFQNRVVERFSRRVENGVEQVRTSIGVVRSIGNDLLFDFEPVRRFTNVVEVAYTEPTAGGDSGSAVVDAAARDVLGIHFAGLGNQGFFIMGSKISAALGVVVV